MQVNNTIVVRVKLSHWWVNEIKKSMYNRFWDFFFQGILGNNLLSRKGSWTLPLKTKTSQRFTSLTIWDTQNSNFWKYWPRHGKQKKPSKRNITLSKCMLNFASVMRRNWNYILTELHSPCINLRKTTLFRSHYSILKNG